MLIFKKKKKEKKMNYDIVTHTKKNSERVNINPDRKLVGQIVDR